MIFHVQMYIHVQMYMYNVWGIHGHRITYAMSRKVNFVPAQRLIFVSTAYLGPIEPIFIDIQMETPGRFESC